MLDDLGCRGDETDLGRCNHRGWNTHNCAHTEDASVICNGKNSFMSGTVQFIKIVPSKIWNFLDLANLLGSEYLVGSKFSS